MIPSAATEERGVLFYELLATTLEGEGGDCAHLAQVADQFRNQNKELLAQIQAEEQAWTPEKKAAVEEQYGDRIGTATKSLALTMSRCDYLENSTSPFCAAAGETGTPVAEVSRMDWTAAQAATPVTETADGSDLLSSCHGCDCHCICPISAGKCATFWFECIGGSHAACCWSGACTGSCSKTCNDSQCCKFA